MSNKTYIFEPIEENELFFYLQLKDTVYPIERGICKDIVNSNKLNSDKDIVDIKHKIIFPYQIQAEKAVLIDEDNMRRNFPLPLSRLPNTSLCEVK